MCVITSALSRAVQVSGQALATLSTRDSTEGCEVAHWTEPSGLARPNASGAGGAGGGRRRLLVRLPARTAIALGRDDSAGVTTMVATGSRNSTSAAESWPESDGLGASTPVAPHSRTASLQAAVLPVEAVVVVEPLDDAAADA